MIVKRNVCFRRSQWRCTLRAGNLLWPAYFHRVKNIATTKSDYLNVREPVWPAAHRDSIEPQPLAPAQRDLNTLIDAFELQTDLRRPLSRSLNLLESNRSITRRSARIECDRVVDRSVGVFSNTGLNNMTLNSRIGWDHGWDRALAIIGPLYSVIPQQSPICKQSA